jgi:uncharacterized protein (TIGR03086 family)
VNGLPELFERSVKEFDIRVEQIKDDQWDKPTPCSEWSVRDLVHHLVYEDVWAPPLFEGQTIEQVGDRFEGELLGDDPKKAWASARDATLAAVSKPGAMEDIVHLSSGEVPGAEYTIQLLNDHMIHAWDLARGIGADDKLDPELVELIYAGASEREQEIRDSGAFGGHIDVPEDADTQTKLLAIMGRKA